MSGSGRSRSFGEHGSRASAGSSWPRRAIEPGRASRPRAAPHRPPPPFAPTWPSRLRPRRATWSGTGWRGSAARGAMDESIVNEFIVESHESLNQVEGDLVALERDPTDRKKLAGVFRAVHTIKGTCGFFGFTKLESVAHAGENLLSQLRSGEIAVNAEIAGALLTLVDALREILTCVERMRSEGKRDYSALIAHLTRLQDAAGAPQTPAGPAPDDPNRAQPGVAAPPPGTIGGGLLDSFVESGRLDPDAVKLAAQQQRLGDPRRIGEILVDHGALKPQDILEALITRGESPASLIKESNIRVDVHVLDLLMNLVGELVLARNQILQYVTSKDYGALPATTQRLNLITTELQEG